jgi:hypothetical protein
MVAQDATRDLQNRIDRCFFNFLMRMGSHPFGLVI